MANPVVSCVLSCVSGIECVSAATWQFKVTMVADLILYFSQQQELIGTAHKKHMSTLALQTGITFHEAWEGQ